MCLVTSVQPISSGRVVIGSLEHIPCMLHCVTKSYNHVLRSTIPTVLIMLLGCTVCLILLCLSVNAETIIETKRETTADNKNATSHLSPHSPSPTLSSTRSVEKPHVHEG